MQELQRQTTGLLCLHVQSWLLWVGQRRLLEPAEGKQETKKILALLCAIRFGVLLQNSQFRVEIRVPL